MVAPVTASTSVGTMIKRLSGMVGTKDLTAWETEFVSSVVQRTGDGARTEGLTEKQLEVIARIHGRHFEAAS
jgi:hypothetical protein